MEIYTRDMFTDSGVKVILEPLYTQLEIVEFNHNYILNQIDSVKKEHFKELYVYETMKKTDKSLIPNITVLTQFKTLERDPTFLDFKKQLEITKKEITDLNNQINKALEAVSRNFSFTVYNLKRYLDLQAPAIYDEAAMTTLMEEIFNYEFNDKSLYLKLRWTRAYHIFGLLVEKSPSDWQSFFADTIKIMYINDKIFDRDFYMNNPEYNNDLEYLMREWETQYNKSTNFIHIDSSIKLDMEQQVADILATVGEV